MPRPKRAKVAPSTPIARARRGILSEKPARAREVSDEIESSQEQNHERVFQPTRKRITRGNEMNAGPSTRLVATSRLSSSHTRVLEESRKRRDSAMSRLEAENESISSSGEPDIIVAQASTGSLSISPEVEVGRRGRVASSVESSAIEPGTFMRRTRQPSILGQGNEMERSVSVDSDIAQSQDIINVERPIGKIMSSGFKPRQRQPSILGRARHMRSSSVESGREIGTPANPGSALGAGLFRRRARQPSILGTPSNNPSHDLKANRNEQDEEDEEDDFNPEDESTPLNLPKSKTLDDSDRSNSPPNPRKRKLSALSALSASQSSAPLSSLDRSPSELSVPLVPSARTRSQTPEPVSPTFAPPHSSSSLRHSPTPPRRTRAATAQHFARTPANRRQPSRALAEDGELPSSPPSLTHSPDNRPSAKRPVGKLKIKVAAKPKPAAFSTAQLQSLLPRRRRRIARDSYDIDSSDDISLGMDEDESSHITAATSRTNRQTPGPRKQVTKLKSAIKGKGKAVAAAQAAVTKRKYGSRHTSVPSPSDKENYRSDAEVSEAELDPDDSLAPVRDSIEDSSVLEERLGKELKMVKRKFEDVDRWEMDFEDMTRHSSSPKDAR